MLPRHPAHVVSRQHRRIAKRFFQHRGQKGQGLFEIGIQDEFMVVGREFLGYQAGVFGFIELFRFKADRKRLHRLAAGPRHQCNNNGGVHPSAQQSTERDIADQANPHGLRQSPLEFFETLFFGQRGMRAILRNIPEFPHAGFAVHILHHMSRR